MRQQPPCDLPISAQPAMLAAIVSAIVRLIVFDHFDIAYQSRSRVRSLKQIVAQQGISGKTSVKNAVNGLYLVNSFSRETPFAIQILVDIRDRAGIDVESGFSRIDRCEP